MQFKKFKGQLPKFCSVDVSAMVPYLKESEKVFILTHTLLESSGKEGGWVSKFNRILRSSQAQSIMHLAVLNTENDHGDKLHIVMAYLGKNQEGKKKARIFKGYFLTPDEYIKRQKLNKI